MAAAFTATDIKRAVKAAIAAGQSVAGIDFPPQGGFRLLFGDPVVLKVQPIGGHNEWDEVLTAR